MQAPCKSTQILYTGMELRTVYRVPMCVMQVQLSTMHFQPTLISAVLESGLMVGIGSGSASLFRNQPDMYCRHALQITPAGAAHLWNCTNSVTAFASRRSRSGSFPSLAWKSAATAACSPKTSTICCRS